ncbi:MAG: carboxypeptidase-like regulatory domain-containing protein, partial [Chryseolinea sp.]
MKQPVLIVCCVLIAIAATAQRFSISGFVKDSLSGESLIGANIVRLKSSAGIASNAHGFYSLSFPTDTITLAVSYTGYRRCVVSFKLKRDTVINFTLSGSMLDEVVVNSSQADEILESTRMSTISLPID